MGVPVTETPEAAAALVAARRAPAAPRSLTAPAGAEHSDER